MRILLTSDWYTPAVNGVVTSVLNLKAGLEARGHDVRVLTLSQNLHSYYQDGGTYIGSLNADMVYPGARMRLGFQRRWVQEILDWHPAVIHSNCEFFTFFLAHHLAEELDIPLVHTYHTVYEDYTHYFSPSPAYGRHLVRNFTRWVAHRTNAMIVPTEKVAVLLRKYGVRQPIYVIPSGIDLSQFQQALPEEEVSRMRRKLGIPEGNTVLASIGRLAKEKNSTELLDGLTAFRGKPVTMLFVGDGPYRAEVQDHAASLGMTEQVIFTGMVPPEDVWKYYRLGDLFLCASTSETQGLTYMEALASGLPVLCRKDACVDGVVVDDENGWQYRDLAEFRARLEYFLEHREVWPALRAAALESSHRFSVPFFAQHVEQVYQEQLSGLSYLI